MRVLNLASFVPVKGLPKENDISLKIYNDLQRAFGITSTFIKPVRIAPRPFHFATRNLRSFRKIFLDDSYIDQEYEIPIQFYDQGFMVMRKLSLIKTKFPTSLEWTLKKNSLFRMVRTFEPSIIHAHEISPSAFYAYRLSIEFKVPYVITLRGRYIPELYEDPAVEAILRHAKCLTTPSWHLNQELKDKYPLQLIPHGLDEKWFHRAVSKNRVGPLQLITVSRLLHMKNIHCVLMAMKELKASGVKFQYTIVGDGPERERLRDFVRAFDIQDQVSLVGHRGSRDIAQYLSKADLFVLLSFPETFGRAYFEAAAQGVVPIGILGTGAHGYLDERQGFFLDKEDDLVGQLVRLLRKINREDLKQKSTACIETAQTFRNEHVIRKYFSVLMETGFDCCKLYS